MYCNTGTTRVTHNGGSPVVILIAYVRVLARRHMHLWLKMTQNLFAAFIEKSCNKYGEIIQRGDNTYSREY